MLLKQYMMIGRMSKMLRMCQVCIIIIITVTMTCYLLLFTITVVITHRSDVLFTGVSCLRNAKLL